MAGKITGYGTAFNFASVIRDLQEYTKGVDIPVVTLMAMQGNEPFKVLFTTILSARTKDQTTIKAAQRLFDAAPTLSALCKLNEERIAELIYPVGFYKTKAANVKRTAQLLVREFGGQVPKTVDELITLPGVGRKTAALVVAECFEVPAICVDTHVHRISNRLGIVNTDTPRETEIALEQIVPKNMWRTWNPLLVAYGQSLCTPISPKCSQCIVRDRCKRIGVTTSR